MRIYVAVTDNSWFRYHAEHKPDEVNFWRPGGGSGFAALEQGAPFLFKLHSPENFIVGGGFFFAFSKLKLSMAWRTYEQKNGCDDFETFRNAILAYRHEQDQPAIDPEIGCILLEIPFFFPREMWIPQPADWHANIVQGRSYDTTEGTGKGIWNSVMERLPVVLGYPDLEDTIREKGPMYVVEGRVGQAGFRTRVMHAYHRRCAITLERTMPALEASHIKPYKLSGPNMASNGILLRADLHQIFDEGYVTISNDYRIVVSDRIRAEYENGREYYQYKGLLIPNLPDDPRERPDKRLIDWHNEHVYRG